jgi:hypothetical protein
VTVFADERGTVAYTFFAYDVGFDGGARVDMADLNGDRVPDLVVAPGHSKNFAALPAPLPVRVYDGRDLNLLVEFVPFAGWKGGLYAAGTDLGADGRALVAVTAEGTNHVKLFDLAQGKEVDDFRAQGRRRAAGCGWRGATPTATAYRPVRGQRPGQRRHHGEGVQRQGPGGAGRVSR